MYAQLHFLSMSYFYNIFFKLCSKVFQNLNTITLVWLYEFILYQNCDISPYKQCVDNKCVVFLRWYRFLLKSISFHYFKKANFYLCNFSINTIICRFIRRSISIILTYLFILFVENLKEAKVMMKIIRTWTL